MVLFFLARVVGGKVKKSAHSSRTLCTKCISSFWHCDVKVAEMFHFGFQGCQGTPGFQAPEILRFNGTEEYNSNVDIYSYAMLLYEMLAGERPFPELSQAQIIDAVLRGQRPDLSQVPKFFFFLPFLYVDDVLVHKAFAISKMFVAVPWLC